MNISVHSLALDTFVPMLRSLSNVLDKGAQHATAKAFDVAVLVKARLAPDMFTLQQQVQQACHYARDAGALLTGGKPAPHESLDEPFEDLKARIGRTIDGLQSLPATAFEGAEDREILIPMPVGDIVFDMNGYQFLRDWALPHFYFHVVNAYDILRHNGVDIGKRDYVGNVARYIRQRPE